jgi:hypothetical protein
MAAPATRAVDSKYFMMFPRWIKGGTGRLLLFMTAPADTGATKRPFPV